VDPNIDDPHSIQNASCYTVYLLFKFKETGEWGFPTIPLPAFQTFDIMKEDLADIVNNHSMTLHFGKKFPTGFSFEKFKDSDLRNSTLCQKLNGRKVFYYEAYHDSGNVTLDKKLYTDFAWVPIPRLSRYLTEEQWNVFRPWFMSL
jgi:hypothetical protein